MGSPESLDEADEAFEAACALYKSAPDKYSDPERLHLYGLYKQATVGPAPSKPLTYVALLRGAQHTAWRRAAALSTEEAKRRYVELVRRASGTSIGVDWASSDDEPLMSEAVEELSKEKLVKIVRALREKVQTLSVGQVAKAGELMRYRETITGGDWSLRWFEVVPGWLRCYRSRTHRELRLEIPLSELTVVKFAEDKKMTRKNGERYVFTIELDKPAARHLSSLRLSCGSREDMDQWISAIRAASNAALSKRRRSMAAPEPKPAASPASRSLLKIVHSRARDSPLSSDQSEPQSFGGLVNLLAVIAIVTNARALINDWHLMPIMIYFFRPTPLKVAAGKSVSSVVASFAPREVATGLLCTVVCALASLAIELAASKREQWMRKGTRKKEHLIFDGLHLVTITSSIVLPTLLVVNSPPRPAVHAGALMLNVVGTMKLVSWAHTNSDLRRHPEDEHSENNAYPKNLRLKDLALFFAFPTLVYQTSYPRTTKVRKRWLVKRCLELLGVLTIMVLVVTQMIAPTVETALEPLQAFDVLNVVERLLALAVPSLTVWILMFVALFELWLSILAEATCFADRLFYRDWWNASKFDEYWRLWNLPVHNWLVRHVFFPIVNSGARKNTAKLAVFTVSALLHELLVSAPCHFIRLYAFLGMMAQIPLISITNVLAEKCPHSRIGNILFWCTFCVFGQPMCIMLYFHDSYITKAADSSATNIITDVLANATHLLKPLLHSSPEL